jgi:hypothetical protein
MHMGITSGITQFRWRRYRLVLTALLFSLLAHATAILLAPEIVLFSGEPDVARFSARLISRPPVPPKVTVIKPAGSAPRPNVRRPVVIAENAVEPVTVVKKAAEPQTDKVLEPPVAESAGDVAPSPPASTPMHVAAESQGKSVDTLPGGIVLEYDLRSSLVDGHADYTWRREGSHYTIDGSIEANGFLAFVFVGRLEQHSRGELTPAGLRPDFFSLKRGDSAAESAEFKWSEKKIKHNRLKGEHVQTLQDGAQDLLSFIFQFAYAFPEKLTDAGPVTFAITNARRMDRYEFHVAGTEKLILPIGEINTVHLVRQTSDPADAYEAWLAVDQYYLPVKLRFMLGGRVSVEQIAVSLTNTP